MRHRSCGRRCLNDWGWATLIHEFEDSNPVQWGVREPNHAVAAFGVRVNPYGKWVVLYTTWGDTPGEQHEEWIYTRGDGVQCFRPGEPTDGYPQLVLEAPYGGEILTSGKPFEIGWYVWGSEITKADLSFSSDGGVHWNCILWRVPSHKGWNSFTWYPSWPSDGGHECASGDTPTRGSPSLKMAAILTWWSK